MYFNNIYLIVVSFTFYGTLTNIPVVYLVEQILIFS